MFSMHSLALKCLLLCVLVGGALCACSLKNHTLWIEKHNCSQCVAINTTICSGYCYTQDTNLRGRFGRTFLIQRSCEPQSLVYRAAHMPGCPDGVHPQHYYPAAHRCSCTHCNSRTHHCVRTRRVSYEEQCTNTSEGVKNQNQTSVET